MQTTTRPTRLLLAAAFALITLVATTARADVVAEWNVIALQVTESNPPGGAFSPRALAITHAAIHDAVNAVERRYEPYAIDVRAPSGASVDAAAASAAHTVLTALYPTQQALLDNALKSSLAKIPDGTSKNDGVTIGRDVAQRLVDLRKNDGSADNIAFTPKGTLGAWQPTPPEFQALSIARWPKVKPFVLKSADQFEVAPPPSLGSAKYAKDLAEVKRLGGIDSKERNADQTAVAIYWVASTWLPWSAVARQESARRNFTVHDNARLFALLNLVSADAYIAGYAAKLKYDQLRPVTAIRNAEKLGVKGVAADPAWTPLLITPAHQDYVSGHASQSGAYEKVLQGVFGGDAIGASSFTYPAGAVTRTYTRLTQITAEDNNARVWGGIHTRSATDAGDALGRKIGEYAVENFLRPLDKQAAAADRKP